VVLEGVEGIGGGSFSWKVIAHIGRGVTYLSRPGPHVEARSAEKWEVTRRFEIEEYA
jgi:hypothetical protein